MNIKEAKEEIVRTVRAYLAKDEIGEYAIPSAKQRPVLLIGPPGIGKTAIMEQAAEECGINLVSYTITHHTRQSAIGLPFISKKDWNGEEYSVTEYTMSEIVASIYEQIERSGVKEGILFLDEINCVSETLAPTMLQFLQYKTFGSHKIPEGFVIVTAGNPPEYNKSVRDFDIVTLDRVRKITVEADLDVWKEYAYKMGVHGAVMGYLEIHKSNFYSIKTDLDGKRFVTARGWEDLSQLMKVYESLDMPVGVGQIEQFLQDPEIAADFADYLELYRKYENLYRIPDILTGGFTEGSQEMQRAPFDEKLSLISLLTNALNQEFRTYAAQKDVQKELFGEMKNLRTALAEGGNAVKYLGYILDKRTGRLKDQMHAHMISRNEEHTEKAVISALQELISQLRFEDAEKPTNVLEGAKNWFSAREGERQQQIADAGEHLTNCLKFMANTFGEGQEIVMFLSELSAGFWSLKFVNECGNEAYFRYNKLLLLKDRKEELKNEILNLE